MPAEYSRPSFEHVIGHACKSFRAPSIRRLTTCPADVHPTGSVVSEAFGHPDFPNGKAHKRTAAGTAVPDDNVSHTCGYVCGFRVTRAAVVLRTSPRRSRSPVGTTKRRSRAVDNRRKGGGVQVSKDTLTDRVDEPLSHGVECPDSPSPSVLWAVVAARLKQEVPAGHFSAWFAQARGVRLDDDNLVIAVPGRFAADWIESRYLGRLRSLASETAGRALDVVLQAEAPTAPEEPSSTIRWDAPPDPPAVPHRREASFHPKYSFESFVIGSSNRFAHAATLAVAEAPAEAYNPLFIYGGAGLGKTHLLHAIGHYVRQYNPSLTLRYVSTEQFTNEFIFSLQRRTIPEFHARYRAADVLLIDDIQFLATRERTQEEFFHTFNALHPTSQIVITSDRPPKKISSLEERLRTRFEWGLISDIQPPDLETRLAILKTKAEIDHIAVPDDVLDYIASRIQTNVRELEGALIRVAAYASLTRSSVTLELATNVLRSLLTDATEARVTPDLVMSVAAEYFDITLQELTSANRSRPLVNARQVAMYLCRELTDLSLPKIGERFGGRDHSTVIHATTKIRKRMKEHTTSYEQVRELTTRVRQQAARG
ncbi:hypothetical protein BH18ACT15_BH18ACT15_14910 [soil metagenome]